MSLADKNFTGSIPDIYDKYLVPLIFEHYADDMASRVAQANPSSVLETAAGSGVVTRALSRLLGPDVRYVATDLNLPMLDRAASQQLNPDRIEWQQADAQSLPFDDNTFDVVCCQFGVMFFPDKVAGYAEARRILKPDGIFVFNVWDRIEENAFAQCVTQTAARLFPRDPPKFLARTPHGHGHIPNITSELSTSGFGQISSATITADSRAEAPDIPAIAYCQGTPLRNELEARAPGQLVEITKAATEDIAAAFGAGPISGQMQGHVFVASA